MHASGDVMTVGDATLTLWMLQNSNVDLNERSGILRVELGDFSMLMLADLYEYGMEQILEQQGPEWVKCNILRYPHHGSQQMPAEFSAVADPDLIIITGANNDRMGKKYAESLGKQVIYTDESIIRLTTDGTQWLGEYIQ